MTNTPAGASPAEQATAGLAAVERATTRLLDVLDGLDDTSVRRPSLLPGWTRAHVVSHLARNADGCLNLLYWARTGVEHPMYASWADRDADIEEGSVRSHRLLLEDLTAASARFGHAARGLPERAWSAEVSDDNGNAIRAFEVPRSRLLEVWVHLTDLDAGVGFGDIPDSDVELLLHETVHQISNRPDVPAFVATAGFGDGSEVSWRLGGRDAVPVRAQGPPGALLGWLLGRSPGEDLSGDVPRLPLWL